MTVPGKSQIQFVPTGTAYFAVDTITDPGGAPTNVLDVDLGFVVSGTVQLPNWMEGPIKVCVYADELGGPFDGPLNPCFNETIVANFGEPGLTVYPWAITFTDGVLPDPSAGSQLYHLAAIFTFGSQSTDIASFVDMGLYLIN